MTSPNTLHTPHQDRLTIETSGHGAMTDLTDRIARIVDEAKITTGVAHIFNIGSTGAIGTIEYEPGLQRDLPETLDRLMPPGRQYGHEQTWHDGNAHSHLQATLMGPSLTVPVHDGALVLGTWQQIIHQECDTRPRQRTIVVTVFGA